MMKAILVAAATILQAYLLGSVDTGILISKFVYHDDVRSHGVQIEPEHRRRDRRPLFLRHVVELERAV